MVQFKKLHSFEDRLCESNRILTKFPGRIPIVVEHSSSKYTTMPLLDKEKFLVPGDLTVSQFIYIIRRRLSLSAETALFLFVGGTLPTTSTLMRELYSFYKDDDGFMYAQYSGETTFGSSSGGEIL